QGQLMAPDVVVERTVVGPDVLEGDPHSAHEVRGVRLEVDRVAVGVLLRPPAEIERLERDGLPPVDHPEQSLHLLGGRYFADRLAPQPTLENPTAPQFLRALVFRCFLDGTIDEVLWELWIENQVSVVCEGPDRLFLLLGKGHLRQLALEER